MSAFTDRVTRHVAVHAISICLIVGLAGQVWFNNTRINRLIDRIEYQVTTDNSQNERDLQMLVMLQRHYKLLQMHQQILATQIEREEQQGQQQLLQGALEIFKLLLVAP